MNESRVPSPAKWPFYAADAVLFGVAIWIVNHYPHPLPLGAAVLLTACVALAAFLGIMPHRMQFQAVTRLAEGDGVRDAVSQIQKIEQVAEQIRAATAQWQTVQEHSTRTAAAAKDISEKIAAEARAFTEFMQRANDSEKATLRLEVEKLRRGEGQWLQVLVHMLDHVFALYQAGARSGQPSLQSQLGRFQEACREVVRRVGLAPFEASAGEPFDGEKHELVEGQPQPTPDARIGGTLAAGYTFQGRLLRKTLVTLHSEQSQTEIAPEASLAEPGADEPAPINTNAEDVEQHRIPDTRPSQDANEPFGEAESTFRLESDALPGENTDTQRRA